MINHYHYWRENEWRSKMIWIVLGLIGLLALYSMVSYYRGEADLKKELNRKEEILKTVAEDNRLLRSQIQALLEVDTTENPWVVKQVICTVFGKDCEQALKVAGCENGRFLQERVNVNKDKSVDSGILQLNSVHLKRFGSGFQKSALENIKTAKNLYDEQGWGPWYSSYWCHQLQ